MGALSESSSPGLLIMRDGILGENSIRKGIFVAIKRKYLTEVLWKLGEQQYNTEKRYFKTRSML